MLFWLVCLLVIAALALRNRLLQRRNEHRGAA